MSVAGFPLFVRNKLSRALKDIAPPHWVLLRSLNNQNATATSTSQICNNGTMENSSFARLWSIARSERAFVHFVHFHNGKWPVLQFREQRQHLTTSFVFSPNLLWQFNSEIVSSHFASQVIEKWFRKFPPFTWRLLWTSSLLKFRIASRAWTRHVEIPWHEIHYHPSVYLLCFVQTLWVVPFF